MDTLLNIRAFLATVREGSFSAAARSLGIATSVVTKRIGRLEDQMGGPLLLRSTRRLSLTEAGHLAVPRFQRIVAEVEDALVGRGTAPDSVEGALRIKAPTTLTVAQLGHSLIGFQLAHPGITLDIVLVDRSVNPVEEGFDIAIGALPATYANVTDVPLRPYPRRLCASPDYLARRGEPRHPRDLIGHDCLCFRAIGTAWSFESAEGTVSVEVRARLAANDSETLHEAAVRGLGVAIVSEDIAAPSLASGALVPLLPGFTIPSLWVRAQVPSAKMEKASVRALLAWIKAEMG